jgi:type II secretory pathway component PulM
LTSSVAAPNGAALTGCVGRSTSGTGLDWAKAIDADDESRNVILRAVQSNQIFAWDWIAP